MRLGIPRRVFASGIVATHGGFRWESGKRERQVAWMGRRKPQGPQYGQRFSPKKK